MANQSIKYQKLLTCAASVALVASAVAPVSSAKDFSDTKGNTHKSAIDALSDAGIISGYQDDSFKPNQTLTRSDVVKLMGKWLVSEGCEVPSDYKTNPRFTDLTSASNDELLKYAAVVKDNGVFNGSNGRLLAGDNITRENMAVVLVRAFDTVNNFHLIEYVEGQNFKKEVSDRNVAKAEARTAIDVLDFFGITTVTQFNPKGTTTRGHFAAFLHNFLNADLSQVTGSGSDAASITAINATTVEVTLVDAIENVDSLKFTIEGLAVSDAAVKQSDNKTKTIVLTTAVQEGEKKYTVALDGEELGSFEGVSTEIPTKIEISTKSLQGKVGEQAVVSADVGVKQAGIPVTFNVIADTNNTLNKNQVFEAVTNDDGIATLSYTQYAAGNDEIVVYPTGAPTVRSHAFVFWGVNKILTISPADKTSEDKGNTLNNGEDKTYKLTYLDPKTGKPIANQRFFVTFEENINVNIDKTSKATVNGVNPYQLLNNDEPSVSSVTTDGKGEAIFTVSGSNTAATPIVYIDNSKKDATTYDTDKLQTKAEKVTFNAAQSEYKIEIFGSSGEDPNTAVGFENGREFTIMVFDKNGEPAANEVVNIALNEDLDRNVATNTEAFLIDFSDYSFKKQLSEKTNAYGMLMFTIVSEKVGDYVTPIAWIDVNSSNAAEGKLDEGEAFKIGPMTYFENSKPTYGVLTMTDGNGAMPRTNKKAFTGKDTATVTYFPLNQSFFPFDFPEEYSHIDAMFTIWNTGGENIEVSYTTNDGQKQTHVISPNRSFTTPTLSGSRYVNPEIAIETVGDTSSSVRVVGSGIVQPNKDFANNKATPINLGSTEKKAEFVSTLSMDSIYTGIIESINIEKKTLTFFDKWPVSYGSASFTNERGVTIDISYFEKLVKENEGRAKVTYKIDGDKVLFAFISVANDDNSNYSLLRKAIDDANTLLNSAKEGTEVGEYPKDALDAYKVEINAAQLVLGNASASQDDINTAIAKLTIATEALEVAKVKAFSFTTTEATANDTGFTFLINATIGNEFPTGTPNVSVNVVDDKDNAIEVSGIQATAFAEGTSTVTVSTDSLAEGKYTLTVVINGAERVLTLPVTSD